MRASTKRFFALLLTVFFFGHSAYLVFNVSVGKWRNVQMLREEQADRLGVRNQLSDLVARATELLGRYADLDKRARPIAAALPAEPKLEEALAILASLASTNNVQLSQVSFEEIIRRSQTGGAPLPVKISVSVNGPYDGFKNWLKGVESELRLMDLVDLTLQPLTAGGSQLNITLNLAAYWQPPPEIK